MRFLHVLLSVLFISTIVTSYVEAWISRHTARISKRLKFSKKKQGQRRSKYNYPKGKPYNNVYGTPKKSEPKEKNRKEWDDYDD